jgi:hypothetical protein
MCNLLDIHSILRLLDQYYSLFSSVSISKTLKFSEDGGGMLLRNVDFYRSTRLYIGKTELFDVKMDLT